MPATTPDSASLASRPSHRAVAAVAVVAVLVAGCAGGGDDTVTAPTPSTTDRLMADEGEIGATVESSAGPAGAAAGATDSGTEPGTGPGTEPGAGDAPGPAATPAALHPSVDDWPAGEVVVDTGDGAPIAVAVRIADTPQQRAHGLMEVAEVPDGTGMWFVYDEDHDGAFWMKGTLTDLDIAWVDDNGRIVATRTMPVCEGDPCPTYDPEATYRTALEVRAGWLDDHGVAVGDRILRGHGPDS